MPGFELVGKEELTNITRIFSHGNGVLFRHGFENLRGNSWCVKNFESSFAKQFEVQDALAVSSGTAALRVSLAALRIGRGDEVITQSFTFIATVEAILESGAKPIIVDVDEQLNLDLKCLEQAISKRTKAIIVVHMLGYPANIKKIKEIAERYSLPVIEDTAWGCGAKVEDKLLGTIGDFGCFSFDHAKALTTGEGGMVVSNNSDYMKRAREFHDHGHENNPDLPRWEDSRSSAGFNFRMSELQGAVGLAQLAKLEKVVQLQQSNALKIIEIFDKYSQKLLTHTKTYSDHDSPSFDAVVIFCQEIELPKLIRRKLLEVGISTKILPEATTWHFAGDWDHIGVIQGYARESHDFLALSRNYLRKSVAIPNFCKLPPSFLCDLDKALMKI